MQLVAQKDEAVPAEWSLARTSLLAALVIAAIQALLLLTTNNGVLHGTLFDPDCYMHLQRALRLMIEGGWHNSWDPRINAPDGYAIHWTVLFDGLLVAGAAPLRMFGLSPQDALYLWGSAISPVLLMAALAVLAWGVRPWVSGASFVWLTILVFTQPQLSGAFVAGRPDHHSLILGLLLAQLACLYAMLDGRAGLSAAIFSGVLGSIQVATSVEGLLTILLVAIIFVLAWAVYRRAVLEMFATYLAACVGTMVLWLAWERGANFFQVDYDRISIVHVVALGAGFLSFTALAATRMWQDRGVAARLAASGIAGGIAMAVTAAIYPDFFLGPWPHIVPAVKQWHTTIEEIQPMLPVDPGHAAQFLAQLSGPLLSLPLILYQLRKGENGLRLAMLVSLCGLVVFGALAVAQMRWSAEVQAVTLLPWTLTTLRIMRSRFAVKLGEHVVPLRSAVLAAALLLQIVPVIFFPLRANALPRLLASSTNAPCSWDSATQALASLRPSGSVILTQLWYGPQILWRTQLRVVGVPYEVAPALQDSYTALVGDEAAARAVVMRRRVNFILVCGAQNGFAGQLAGGVAPDWLQAVTFMPDAPGFRLYRVRDASS